MFKGLLTLTAILVLSFGRVNAQNQIMLDSLNLALSNARVDSVKAEALLELSKFYLRVDYAVSLDYAQQALDIAKDRKLSSKEAKANRAIGLTHFYIGNYKQSVKHYFNALSHYEAVKDSSGLIAMNNNLGAVYDRLLDFDKALIYYLKARDLLTNYSDQEQKLKILPSLYNNIGNVYQTRSEIPSAIEYYEKALSIAEETKRLEVQGTVLNNLGKLYLYDLNDVDASYDFLKRGLAVRKELGDKAEMSKSYNNLAHYYRLKGKYDEAKKSVREAINLGVEIGSLEAEKFGYANLSEIERDRGDYKAALEAHVTFKNLSDSIQNQLTSSEISKLQMQYDFEKETQARDHEQAQLRNRYLIIIIALTVLLLVTILIMVIIRSRSKQSELKRRNLSQDIEIKNKELTTNVMYLIRKNELINDVAGRLLKIQPNVLPENNKVVQSIIIDLQREADNDTWQEFELRFNQVHTDFYENLRKLYPDLSPAEEKLCAFLRLNMSSKDVAAITQQSIKSVEVARARLRKKLNLTNTNSNLVSHLTSI